jgi:hypothetical protein
MWATIMILGIFLGLPMIGIGAYVADNAIDSWREVQLAKYSVNKENEQ